MRFVDKPLLWDIFCQVVDNFGDIGVCWRLARQLAVEHGFQTRLWVSDLDAFGRIENDIDSRLEVQSIAGVEIHRWDDDFPTVVPGDFVVEAFACHLPELFIEAMAHLPKSPVWVNLDYLSAEDWVIGCHALPSPHPKLPLTKYFFFPGFTAETGGLLRERGLEPERQAFLASQEQQGAFWQMLHQTPPTPGALLVSLFAYESPGLAPLLKIWATGEKPICCLAPVTRTLPAIEEFAGRSLTEGETVRSENLEIRLIPFVSQPGYDHLLWLCDLNFVRGEDSFIRAQWAAKPLIWHIYPQEDEAHRTKLAAFLKRYADELPSTARQALNTFHGAWNDPARAGEIPASWAMLRDALPKLREHAGRWEKKLLKQHDLCSSLVHFCKSKL